VNSGAKSLHPNRIFASLTIMAWTSASGTFGFFDMVGSLLCERHQDGNGGW